MLAWLLLGFDWRTCPVTRIDVSATEVRERVRQGRSIRYLVPEPVRASVERNSLYEAPVMQPARAAQNA